MPNNFQNLVFEGGGVKGIAYGGALEMLDQKGILQNIKRVAGTSAGAINATLLSIGYDHSDVSDIIAKSSFRSFEDDGPWIISNLRRLFNRYGWYKGDFFLKWVGEHIEKKSGKADLTFEELQSKIDNKEAGYRELFIVSTNLSRQKYIMFSSKTTPKVAIKDAVRMSMSIPLYFQSFNYLKDIMVDGGVSYNYPINIFDHVNYLANPENCDPVDYSSVPGYCFNHETLGFRLDSTQVMNYAMDDWAIPPVEIKGIKGYSTGLVNFMMEMANKRHLHSNDWNRTIFIDTLDVRTTDFDLGPEKIQALIASGREGVNKFFSWRENDPEWSGKPKAPVASDVVI